MGKIQNPNEYIQKDNYYILKLISPKYGIFNLLIDSEDVEKCKKYHWCIHYYKSKEAKKHYFYGINNEVGLFHRYIIGCKDMKVVVDHINGDTLDTRKENLQIISRKNNVRKASKREDGISGHKGVYWTYRENKWVSGIVVDRKFKNLGYYDFIEDVIDARKQAEIKYYGKYIPIN